MRTAAHSSPERRILRRHICDVYAVDARIRARLVDTETRQGVGPLKPLTAPFPYFGGKRRIAPEVWLRFGDVANYIEPFCGSAAVLLARPTTPRVETINDVDAFVTNFWRAVKASPEEVAAFADWPVNEIDLEARHKWLVQVDRKRELYERMRNEPDFFDAKVAGWWVWGLSSWIGRGWCEGEFHGADSGQNRGRGVNVRDPERGGKFPHFTSAQGVNSVALQVPRLTAAQGVNSIGIQAPRIDGFGGTGTQGVNASILQTITDLSARLRRVRVVCGDWDRVITPSVTRSTGHTGIFFDPPYGAKRSDVYSHECFDVAANVREWCAANGANKSLRIALCGYDGEHNELEALGWRVYTWKANGGYGNQSEGDARENATKERIWFSPHCDPGQQDLFDGIL